MQHVVLIYIFKLFQFLITLFYFILQFCSHSIEEIFQQMLQIKSYKPPVSLSNSSSTLKNVFTSICDKIDYQLQCKIDYPSAGSSPIKRKKYAGKENQQNSINKNAHRSFMNRSINTFKQHSPDNRIYLNVEIKKISREHEKICKILENIALNKKCHTNELNALRNKLVKINRCDGGGGILQELPKIELNMETLFKIYLQAGQDEFKESILSGKLHSKIIKPFLSVFERIKLDSSQIGIKCQNSENSFSKSQIYRIFNQYKPKIVLKSQIQQMKATSMKVYEELYKKYEGVPIYGHPEEKSEQTDGKLLESDIQCDQNCGEVSENEAQDVCEPQITEQQVQQQKNQQNRQNQEESNDLDLRKSALKQRFESRFKKNLRLLSDEANEIFKARFQ